MWDIIQGATSALRGPTRKTRRFSMLPAMIVGAGVGIAAWEMAKRRTANMSSDAHDTDQ